MRHLLLVVAIVAGGHFASAAYAQDAERGKAAYAASCASCHGKDLGGTQFGPPVAGATFKAVWANQPAEALSTYVQTKMPPSQAGALPSETYADIDVYLRQANNFPVGSAAGAVAAAKPSTPEPTVEGGEPNTPHLEGPIRGSVLNRDATYTATLARRKAQLQALSPVSDAMLRRPSDADWLSWRGSDGALGYSRLAQINRQTVGALRPAWTWSLPIGQNEITPLVHDGVMFVESGNSVQALDAASGELLWQYIHPLPAFLDNGRSSRVKSMAIFEDRIFAPFPDGRLVALDMRSGKVVWQHYVAPPDMVDRHGGAEGDAVLMTGGPIVARGKIIVGVSLGQVNSRGGCFILALDARTGDEVWRFNTIARPGEPGGDSWNGAPVEERYGGGVWTAGSYDPELNLVYFGVGNTYDTATLLAGNPKQRPGNYGLYTDSTLALNPDTGKMQWYFQHHHRDVWDLDWVFEQTLIDMPVDGRPRKLVLTAGKIALFDAVDRATGQFVFSKDTGLQNVVLSVDPKTGEKKINPAIEPEAGKAKLVCPGAIGARNWQSTSVNPETMVLFVPMVENCMDYTYAPRSAAETAAGGMDMRTPLRARPDSDGNVGRLEAIDLKTRQVLWSHRQRSAIASSALATAGGVVFNGDHDRMFAAFDQATGAVLWQTRLNAAPSSYPIAYSVGGKQYVAVVAGGGGPFDSAMGILTPEANNPAPGVTVWVFELPGN